MNSRARFAIVLLGFLCLDGCVGRYKPPKAGYFGPTLPLDEVVRRINQNNQKITTLWASFDHFQATLVDPQQRKQHYISGGGTLLYAAPSSLRLIARNDLYDLFDLGCNGDQFWFWLKHEDTFWWGSFSNLLNADVREIPIRPDLLLEVLGTRPIDPRLLDEPAPTVRFNNDADAYMIDWNVQRGDRWTVQKEIWYDRASLRPEVVLLYDAEGRVVLRAWLSIDEAVEADPLPKDQWPVIATHYQLFFPDTQSHMSFQLGDVKLSRKGFPKPASFRMPNPAALQSAGQKVIRVDEGGSR